MLQPWWERFPEVLREEEADLERLGGRPPSLNEALLERAGIRQYEVSYSHDTHTYKLAVTFSDLHPYFRPEVTTSHVFRTHQQPFRGNLCLIRGGTWNWNVDETAAQLIESQMPALIADDKSVEIPETPDDDVGPPASQVSASGTHVEPFVGYYTYVPGTAIRVDGDWAEITEADRGTLVVGLDQPPAVETLRGTVLEIRDSSGHVIRRAGEEVAAGYPNRLVGRWCRLNERPPQDEPQSVLDATTDLVSTLVPERGRVGEFEVDLVGAVFTDGVRPEVDGDAWIFVVHGIGPRPRQRPGAGKGKRGGGRVAPDRRTVGPYLARAFRSGMRDMTERVPSLAPLREKKVVIFGAGGVGAPSAVEFAKAGVGALVIVESDSIEPGNAPRWVMGYQAAGLHKLDGMNQLIRWNWPYTRLGLVGRRVGLARSEADQRTDWEILNELLGDADLVYDATAEIGVNYFLSEVSKEFGLPYVVASATEGGWGGRVARFKPGTDTACWTCLMNHEEDDPNLIPPRDPDPASREVWPAGCTDPTFTGTGFDITAIATAGVRLAVSTLCAEAADAYPAATWDLAVYQFRDARATLPGTGVTYELQQHPDCEPCRIRRSG